MSVMNEVRNKIAFKKQEIMKLQLEKVAMKVEIKKTEEQLKSVMALMDDFEVIFLCAEYFIVLKTLENFFFISTCFFFQLFYF